MRARRFWRRGAARPEAAAAAPDGWIVDEGIVREQTDTVAHYRKMYERSSALARIGVWECDLATDVLTWTDGVYDLFELPRGSAIRRSDIVALYHDESRREMERLRAAAIRDCGSFRLDIRIRTAKGNDRWLHLTADVEQENGRAVRIFGTKQDVTEAKAAQEKVRALQHELIHVSRRSAMGAMAATLAHELNQPLAAISNYAAGTRRALNRAEPAKAVIEGGLEKIERCAFRAANIIRSLRELTTESPLSRQPVNANPLIREAASLALAGMTPNIVLAFDLDADAVVPMDPVQIQQVVINLVRNAGEAMQDSMPREILVSTLLSQAALEIRVEDTGPGIAADMLGKLFDSFVSTKAEGMGVGLSISRTIVEAHGGRISATNRQEGGGASFRVTLPLAASPA